MDELITSICAAPQGLRLVELDEVPPYFSINQVACIALEEDESGIPILVPKTMQHDGCIDDPGTVLALLQPGESADLFVLAKKAEAARHA